jgi:pyruvate dehydrogenase E2 component (dihydrolipoamide acetyltransferase)
MGAVIAAAVARAAAANRAMNGHWVDGRHVERDEVDLGMAVSLRGGGLLAPVIPGAERLGVPELMERLRTIVTGARSGSLPGWAMGEPTLTVTAQGDRGVDVVYGVIYPPQVTMVGVGVVAERPWVDAGLVVAAPTVTVSVAADHRASDGHDGARFVHAVAELLAHPEVLAMPTDPATTAADPTVAEDSP